MAIDDPRQFFVLKLSKQLEAEKEILKTLKEVQKEASDPELSSRFEHHAQETQQHVRNLQQAFDHLGERPLGEKPRVAEALVTDHNQFNRQNPSPDVLDAFLVGAAVATEHHEIAEYEGLITMAEAMGEQEIVELLRQNLEQEQHTLEEARSAQQRLAQRFARVPA
jgi:ferritin-like metal-binding protein YciE